MSEPRDWLVVMTKPKLEAEAETQLLRQEYEVYLPLWADLKRRRGQVHTVRMPMFPRYLFARPSHEGQSISPIRSTRGVSQLVRFGTTPARASEALIEDIRRLEAARIGAGADGAAFKVGDQVQVMDGPFKGLSAEVFESDEQRVILLLQVLGGERTVAFEPARLALR
ncbi:MAG: transcriptional activator RfaH [Alphaproteobacteria bacterium]|nr:transcriptional activator RfaH [Alphaproteobacteria bacterium]